MAPPHLSEADLVAFQGWKKAARKSHANLKQDKKEFLNELVYSSSPYLKQHALNPVNWKPWSNRILEQAKRDNKLIFLSIGYSTCHWCHVMAKESFIDVNVAELINKNFIAVKVDREELPHIDEYYAAALEQVKGSAGWPITAIINSEGLPIFIESYLSKQKLQSLLQRMSVLWLKNSDFLISSAKQIDSLLKARFSFNTEHEIPPNYLASINSKLLGELDKVNGGFVGEVKFPSESMLLYMLDQLARQSNPAIEEQLKLSLDSMMSGGLWDHVGGGFHRYSTDSEWLVPHYEKMLYNQAQLAIVYSRAYKFFGDEKYKRVVQRIVNFTLKTMHQENLGFWSAIDADFNGDEGGYYLWSASELSDFNGELLKTYSVRGTDKLGVLTSHSNETAEKQHQIFKTLSKIRKARGIPHIDKKILTSWNSLMILALVEAAQILGNEEYFSIAEKLAESIWTNRFSTQSGELARLAASQQNEFFLEDYSFFARALIALYDYSGKSSWLDKSNRLVEHGLKLFVSVDGKLNSIYPNSAGFGISKVQDNEVFNPIAMFVRVISLLDNRLGKKNLKSDYKSLLQLLKSKVTIEPLSHLLAARVLNNQINGEISDQRYFAESKGQLNIECKVLDKKQCLKMSLNIKLMPGWHINSNKPLQDYLIATKVEASSKVLVNYPKEKVVKLGFQKEPLSVFEGRFSIELEKHADSEEDEYIQIPLQACSDSICLLPEHHIIKF